MMDGNQSTKPYTDTPAEILRTQQDHISGFERFRIVTHWFDIFLLVNHDLIQIIFFLAESAS